MVEAAVSTEAEVDALVDKVVSQPASQTEDIEVMEDIPVVDAEPVVAEEESFFQKGTIIIKEVEAKTEEAVEVSTEVPEPEPISEIMEAVKEEEYPPVPEKPTEVIEPELPVPPKVEVEGAVQVEQPVPVTENVTSPEAIDMKLKEQFADIVEDREVKIEEPQEIVAPPVPQAVKVVEDIPPEPEIVEEPVPEPEPVVMETQSTEPAQEVAADSETGIDFSATEIQNFASFLVQKKETILDEDFEIEDLEFKMDDIKGLSAYLFSGSKTETEEIKENQETAD